MPRTITDAQVEEVVVRTLEEVPEGGTHWSTVVPYHVAILPSSPCGHPAVSLTGLLDQLGYEQADVLGISWGGGLAQQFALRRPDRVRRLVLVATSPGALMVPGHPRVLLASVVDAFLTAEGGPE